MKNYLSSLENFSIDVPLSSFSMEDKGYSKDNEANEYINQNPFAFICGLIFDQSIQSSLAWSAPLKLCDRLGNLNPSVISNLSESELKELIAQKPALHRYPQAMARNLIKTSQILLDKYQGNAELLWRDVDTSKVLKKRLLELGGIGEKKANLALTMLQHDFGVNFISMDGAGLALDVHLNRVLSRSGYFDISTKEGVSKTNNEFSDFFGSKFPIIGTHIWMIGRKHCNETDPKCLLCPLSDTCKKVI